MNIFIDTSALIKRYVNEDGSDVLQLSILTNLSFLWQKI